MITKFKIYENNKEPQVGNFVICNMGSEQLRNNEPSQMIGEIIEFEKVRSVYRIKFFQKLPQWLRVVGTSIKDSAWFFRSSIIEWSENREDLDAILDAEKYNL
jgi:hypothetical protein